MFRKISTVLAAFGVVLSTFLWTSSSVRAEVRMSQIKADEQVIFFPTDAHQSDDGESWTIPIHGWIFEPEEHDLLRRAAMHELHEILDLPENLPTAAILDDRLRPFLVDNERSKEISIRIADEQHTLPSSDRDGHFLGTIQLSTAKVDDHLKDGRLHFQAVTSPGDERVFAGLVYCLSPEGVSMISDIDDTIKITNVRNRRALVENTFLRDFQAVDGMAALYRQWAEKGAQLHFVSASPWQLYEPLARFTSDAGFPDAIFNLKRFRLKDSSFFELFEDPIAFKLSIIEPLFQDFPARRFILVGDSGEKDPETYGTLARNHPGQIIGIYIRDVTNEPRDAPRYREAFRDVPSEKWQLFDDPATLQWPDTVSQNVSEDP
jgi:hypothetical protein